ncbi:hypothetical protein HOH87_06745 [bacterium]|jgi:hypothetical protein|nr:hypothetical protein [bacterium]
MTEDVCKSELEALSSSMNYKNEQCLDGGGLLLSINDDGRVTGEDLQKMHLEQVFLDHLNSENYTSADVAMLCTDISHILSGYDSDGE